MINGIALIIRKEDACQFFGEKNFFLLMLNLKEITQKKFYTDHTGVMVNILS